MTWWMWIVLAVFCIGVVIAGCIHTILRGLKALGSLGETADTIGTALDALNDSSDDPQKSHTASFAVPLSVAASHYEDTRRDIELRRVRRRQSHRMIWRSWAASRIPETLEDTGFAATPEPSTHFSSMRNYHVANPDQ
ncbi:hypothetical protein [uncultured Bifidobacterium sp.]|uniref:hypothetical protein n=1 Tax=uncultured Bifidobacterium sp. TaxID=165187 RepID=UPI00263607BE|nr:hypothetical protein [uncultured Bifidobacterium sp.]